MLFNRQKFNSFKLIFVLYSSKLAPNKNNKNVLIIRRKKLKHFIPLFRTPSTF